MWYGGIFLKKTTKASSHKGVSPSSQRSRLANKRGLAFSRRKQLSAGKTQTPAGIHYIITRCKRATSIFQQTKKLCTNLAQIRGCKHETDAQNSRGPQNSLKYSSAQHANKSSIQATIFFIWMLHGSTKVVVRAVALLSAKTKDKVANSLKKCFRESNILETNKQQTNHIAVSRRVQGRVGVACSSDG